MTNTKTKTFLTGILAAVVVSMAAGNPMAYADFSGDYDPANWTLTTNGGDGSVDDSLAPASIELTGSNTGSDSTINTDYTATIVTPCGATVDFDWDYETFDTGGPSFDPAGYLVNGAFTQVTSNGGSDIQSGSESVPVFAGDSFGFRIHSTDDGFGEAEMTISNFTVTPDDACADIDIKPRSDPNSINLTQKGVIAVAILGSDTYNVSDVDFSTLVFEGATPKHNGHEPEDVNGDGFLDLVAHFPTQDVGLVSYDSEGCLSWDDSQTSNVACDDTRVFDAPNGDLPNGP